MKRILLALCAITLISLPILAPAQTPEQDRGYIQGFLEDALSDAGRAVTITGFAGALSSRATMEQMTIADDDGVWLTLRGVTLDWNRSALLAGRVEVTALTAKELLIPRAPQTSALPDAAASEAAGTGFALPELPVSVRVDRLSIEKLALGAPLLGQEVEASLNGSASLSGGQGSADLTLKRIDAGGEFALKGGYENTSRNLEISLKLQEPADGIVANLIDLPGKPALSLTVAGNDPLSDFTATLQLATDGRERLSGTLTLIEDTAALPADAPEGTPAPVTHSLNAELGGDLAPVFAPQYRPFFGDDIRLTLSAAKLPDGMLLLNSLDLRADALSLRGSGAVSADGWPARLDLTGRIAPADGQADVLLPVGVDETRIAAADLSLTYDATKGDTLLLDLSLLGLNHPQITLERAAITGNGTLTRGDGSALGALDTRLDLTANGVVPTDANLAAALGQTLTGGLTVNWQENQPLRLSDIALRGSDYGLKGALTLRVQTDPANLIVDHDLTLDAQNLSRFAPLASVDLNGAADLRVAGKLEPLTGLVDTRITGATSDLSLAQPRLDPLLAGQSALSLHLLRDAKGTAVNGLSLTSDLAQITGKAALRDDASFANLTAELSDLAPVEPRLNGPAKLDLSATQSGQLWTVKSDITAPGQTSATLNATITNGDSLKPVSARLNASIGQLGPWSAIAGQSLSGGADLDATLDAEITELTGALNATLRGSNLAIGNTTVDPLMRGASSLKITASRNAAGKILVQSAEVRADGLSADLSGSVDDETTAITLDARLGDIGRIVPEISGPATLSGTARNAGGPWQINLSGTGPAGIRLSANGSVAQNAGTANLSLDGTVPLALANDALAPRSLGGFADFDLSVNGPLALSSVSGRVVTRDARLAAPGLRVSLQNLIARVALSGGRAQLNVTAGVSSGGNLAITGPVTLSAPYNADIKAQLNDIVLSDPELYETSVFGALFVKGPLTGGARINGTLKLGETDLRIPSGGGSGYAGLPGLKHRNEPFESRRTRDWAGLTSDGSSASNSAPAASFPLDVTIVADSRIFVRGRGLDAELGGRLRVTGTTANVVPVGRFDLIRGRFDVLGKRFDLTEGRAQLQGALDPWVRFVAETEASGTTVRIILEGQASEPELTFESSPTLPQDEVLSLILFEREAAEISPLQAIRLAAAIRTLSGKGGAGLVGNIRDNLALDDLDVSTADDGTTEARVGKYISDKIYTDVTVNSDGESQINLNLKINPRLTVRGRAGSDGDTGIGVYYEKDY